MKSLILLVGLTVVSVCVLNAQANTKTKVKPDRDCDFFCLADYRPVCATDGDKVNLTFGNKCSLDRYNCEHNSNLVVKAETECPNN